MINESVAGVRTSETDKYIVSVVLVLDATVDGVIGRTGCYTYCAEIGG